MPLCSSTVTETAFAISLPSHTLATRASAHVHCCAIQSSLCRRVVATSASPLTTITGALVLNASPPCKQKVHQQSFTRSHNIRAVIHAPRQTSTSESNNNCDNNNITTNSSSNHSNNRDGNNSSCINSNNADVNNKAEYLLRVRETLTARCVGADNALWEAMQAEARTAAEEEPLLASFMFATVLNHRSLQSALAFHLANKLASNAIPATQLMRLFTDFMEDTAGELMASALQEDLLAVVERDPACNKFIDCLCYYKGFLALEAHRIAHALWKAGRVAIAYHVQAQVSKALQVDIHPAAVIGPGAFLDHATGVVIGETAIIGKNLSMLHHVTLGGSGKRHGVRHPQIGDGVLIGAGATLLGNVSIGDGAQIGACSLVLEDVPAHSTVVGVPAKVVYRGDKTASKVVPALDMKHERCLQNQGECRDTVDAKNSSSNEPQCTESTAIQSPVNSSMPAYQTGQSAARQAHRVSVESASGNGVPANSSKFPQQTAQHCDESADSHDNVQTSSVG